MSGESYNYHSSKYRTPGGGGGGYSGFQVTGMIEWGLPTKPKKIPGPKINPKKIPCRISEPENFPERIK